MYYVIRVYVFNNNIYSQFNLPIVYCDGVCQDGNSFKFYRGRKTECIFDAKSSDRFSWHDYYDYLVGN